MNPDLYDLAFHAQLKAELINVARRLAQLDLTDPRAEDEMPWLLDRLGAGTLREGYDNAEKVLRAAVPEVIRQANSKALHERIRAAVPAIEANVKAQRGKVIVSEVNAIIADKLDVGRATVERARKY